MDNSLRGYIAYTSGKQFEDYLVNIFKGYAIKKISYVNKIDHQNKHKNTHARKEKLRSDYEGYTTQDIYTNKKLKRAVPVYIEAKSVLKANKFNFSQIKYHQLEWLYQAYQDGCYAFLVIGFVEYNCICRIEVDKSIHEMISKTIKSNLKYSGNIKLEGLKKIIKNENIFTFQDCLLLGYL